MKNASNIILDLIEKNGNVYEIHKANFLLELIDYVQNSDYAMFKEYQFKTYFELLAHDSEFLKFASEVYNKFINSNEYNLYKFIEENY